MSGPPGRSPHHINNNSRTRRSLRNAILGIDTTNVVSNSNSFDLDAVTTPTFTPSAGASGTSTTTNNNNRAASTASSINTTAQLPSSSATENFHQHHNHNIFSPNSASSSTVSNPVERLIAGVPVTLPVVSSSSYVGDIDPTTGDLNGIAISGGDHVITATVSSSSPITGDGGKFSSSMRRGAYAQSSRDRGMTRCGGGGGGRMTTTGGRSNFRPWSGSRRSAASNNNNNSSSSLTSAARRDGGVRKMQRSSKEEETQWNCSRRKENSNDVSNSVGVHVDEEGDDLEGGILVHGILPQPSSSSSFNKLKPQQNANNEEENIIVEGENFLPSPLSKNSKLKHHHQQNQKLINKDNEEKKIQKLRKLTSACLFSSYSTSSPTTAVFYASILYTKTRSPYDGYVYAQALYANDEKKRAVFFLERVGLLSHNNNVNNNCDYYENSHHFIMSSVTTSGVGEKGKTTFCNDDDDDDDGNYNVIWLTLESMLLGAKCLADLGEWEEVTSLLEDACRLPQLDRGERVENTEDPTDSVLRLVRYLKNDKANSNIFNNYRGSRDKVHCLARICVMRGKAYDEGSNPTRAASFLKLALQIDYKCVDAWIYLCQRHLLTWEEELCLVLKDMKIDVQMQADDDVSGGMDWLKDIYLSRLSYQTNDWNLSNVQNDDSGNRNENEFEVSIEVDKHHPKFSCFNVASSPNVMNSMDASSILLQSSSALSPSIQYGIKNEGSSLQALKCTLETKQAFQNLSTKHNLSQSPEILSIAATRAYNSYNLPLALHYCQTIYEMDPLCSSAAHIQIATLTGLGQKRPLFRLAHALVNAGPKSAVAWYAVGCYYYACGQYDLAQRNFCRATRLDPRSAECWIAFGCAFASCDENDQANACFRVAHRLHSGSHYPMLYMGMEHLRTNNLTLAGHFLKSAGTMGRNDPLCCNELGVWAYMEGEWNDAVRLFVMALRLCVKADLAGRAWVSLENNGEEEVEERSSAERVETKYSSQLHGRQLASKLSDQDCIEICQEPFWEPTIFNLGQSYRKARRYDEALLCFEKCLVLCPGKDSSYSALGFTRHISGDLEGAIEAYHQALGNKPDDPFASEMLSRALQEALDVFKPSSNDIKFKAGRGGSAASVQDSLFHVSGLLSPPPQQHPCLSDTNQSEMMMNTSVSTASYLQGNSSDVDMSTT